MIVYRPNIHNINKGFFPYVISDIIKDLQEITVKTPRHVPKLLNFLLPHISLVSYVTPIRMTNEVKTRPIEVGGEALTKSSIL